MKKFFLYCLLFLFSGCYCYNRGGVYSEAAMQETLVSPIMGKILKSGVMSFLLYENNTYRIIKYDCQIDLNRKSVICRKYKDEVIDIKGKERYPGWYTAESFKKYIERSSTYQKYYKCFSEDFLDLSNDEKLKLIDELSKRKRTSEPKITNQGKIYVQDIRSYEDIPEELLINLDKMGVDNSSELNEYESRYLNLFFNVDPQIDLVGKRVAFLHYNSNKMDYFNQTKERYNNGSGVIVCCALYVFDPTIADDCGYDAAVVSWSKVLIPIDKVIKRLKNRK